MDKIIAIEEDSMDEIIAMKKEVDDIIAMMKTKGFSSGLQ